MKLVVMPKEEGAITCDMLQNFGKAIHNYSDGEWSCSWFLCKKITIYFHLRQDDTDIERIEDFMGGFFAAFGIEIMILED